MASNGSYLRDFLKDWVLSIRDIIHAQDSKHAQSLKTYMKDEMKNELVTGIDTE